MSRFLSPKVKKRHNVPRSEVPAAIRPKASSRCCRFLIPVAEASRALAASRPHHPRYLPSPRYTLPSPRRLVMDARTIGAVIVSSVLSSALSAIGVRIAFSANCEPEPECAQQSSPQLPGGPGIRKTPSGATRQVETPYPITESQPVDLVVRSLKIVDANGVVCLEAGVNNGSTFLILNDGTKTSSQRFYCDHEFGSSLSQRGGQWPGGSIELDTRPDGEVTAVFGSSKYDGTEISYGIAGPLLSVRGEKQATVNCSVQGGHQIGMKVTAIGNPEALLECTTLGGGRLEMRSQAGEHPWAEYRATVATANEGAIAGDFHTASMSANDQFANLAASSSRQREDWSVERQSRANLSSDANSAGVNTSWNGLDKSSSTFLYSSFDPEKNGLAGSRLSLMSLLPEHLGSNLSLTADRQPSIFMNGDDFEPLWLGPEFRASYKSPPSTPGVPVEPGSPGAQWGGLTTEEAAAQSERDATQSDDQPEDSD